MPVASISTIPSSQSAVYFVDASLGDLDTLLAALPTGANIVLLDPSQDGLAQIRTALDGLNNIGALHIVTHGSAGNIHLGSSVLNADTLAAASNSLQSIGEHLSNDADILFYGCDVAANDAGKALIGQIADLTGADVAASTDLTGASSLGGDWELEASTGAIEASGITAFAYGSALSAPTISGFGPASYTENTTASVLDSSVTLSGGSSYGGGYIRFNLTGSNSADQLTLNNAASVNASGAISFVGSTVYLGNGSGRDAIGSIDSTENGQNGKALKINFTANFTNPSFETGTVTGWTIGKSQVKLGSTVINGKTSPADPTFATNSGGDGDTPQSFSYDSQLVSGGASNGSYSLRLYSNGTTSNGYDVVHGPYAYSNTFTASAGDVLYFDWKAQGGSDAYDAFGYLMNADTGESAIVLNSTGANASVTTNWATASVTVPKSGNWFFVFVAGTWDATGGQAAGGSLYIDNVKVFGNKVNDTVAQTIISQVAYQNTAEDAPTSRNLTLTIADGSGATTTSTAALTINNVNDAPTLTSGAVLPGVQEDASSPIGATVQSLFGNKFSDVDNTYSPTDSLAGVVVVANAATAAEGKWQYTTANTPADGDWKDIGTVDTSSGLVLSATTKVRFLPGTDYPTGTHNPAAPGSLTVHGVDSSYAGVYSTASGGTESRQTFDTTTDGITSPVSAAGVTLSTTVTEVNDAPRFTGVSTDPYTASYTETSSADASGAGALMPTSGTLTASDVENDSFHFGIRGGVLNAGVESKVGLYGTLSVNATSGVWSYTPNATAINALKDGVEATDSFEFKVTDSAGSMSVQTFTATITGANDTPVVATSLTDQTMSGGASWSYQLPANAFTDAEGTGLTYSVKLVTAEDGLTLRDPDGGGTKNAGDLPGSLTFDPVTRTFSGSPGANGDFYIQVTTSDGAASASDVFKLTVSGVNQAPVYNGGLGPKVVPSGTAEWSYEIPDTAFTDPEGQPLTWSAFVDGTNLETEGTAALTFDPTTRTLSGDGSTLPGGVVEIRVTDTAANTTAAQFSIVIAATSEDSVALNGANPIPDTTWTGAGSHAFTIPADSFMLDGDSATTFSATLANDAPLPTWLTFNATSGTFTGNPPTSVT